MSHFDRRQLLTATIALAVAATPFRAMAQSRRGTFPVSMTDAQWRSRLSADAYAVLRGHGTERPHSSALDREHRRGTFACAGCGNAAFSSTAKFDSGTGWPSFFRALPGGIGTSVDRSQNTVRNEIHCARCGGHLGHVFDDGPRPTGLRYCMNGVALSFCAG